MSCASVGDGSDQHAEDASAEDGGDNEGSAEGLVVRDVSGLQVDVKYTHEAACYAARDGEDEAQRHEAVVSQHRRKSLAEIGAGDGC